MSAFLQPVLDTVYWSAAIVALAGAIILPPNRVVWPLLGSFAFCQVARWLGWEFDRDLWATVDCAALIVIAIVLLHEARKDRLWLPSRSQVAVVFLFVPMLASYGLDPPAAYYLSMTAGIAQLLVIPPYRALFARWKETFADRHEWTDFDKRVVAA